MNFRAATPQEDSTIAQHFYQMWCDLGMTETVIQQIGLQ